MANAGEQNPMYMLIGLQTKSGGQYQAVGPQGSSRVEPYNPKRDGDATTATAGGRASVGGPDPGDLVVVVIGDWVYVTGSEPVVTSAEATGGAPRSAVAMQLLASAGGGTITRFIVLESSSGSGYIRLPWQSPADNVVVPEHFFVDVENGVIGEPGNWDARTPGFQELETGIAEARRAWGI